jgi:hypothetical protein
MKIAEYKQMMEYLTRPGFNGGGSVRNKTILPKKKPEEEVKKRKIKNFEKAKPALENPKEVKEMMDLADGGRIGFSKGGSAALAKILNELPDGTEVTRDMVQKIIDDNNLDITVRNFFAKPSKSLKEGITLIKRKSPVEITDELLKKLDNYIKNTPLDLKAIGEDIGYKETEKGKSGGLRKRSSLIKAYEEKYGKIPDNRFKPYKLDPNSDYVKNVISLREELGSTNAVAKELKLDNKTIRNVLKAGNRLDLIGDVNVAGPETGAKKIKKRQLEIVKEGEKKAGPKTTKQARQVKADIADRNKIYANVSAEELAKDKNFLKRLRLTIDGKTGAVDFTGYTEANPVRGKVFNDVELAQHAINKAKEGKLFTHDHITPKRFRKQNIQYPINFQPVTYMENSQFENARTYLTSNPSGNVAPINSYLKSNNKTIRFGKNKYGYTGRIVYNSKTGDQTLLDFEKRINVGSRGPVVSTFGAGQKFPSFGKAGQLAKGVAKGEGVLAPLFVYGGSAYGLPFKRSLYEATYGLAGDSKSDVLKRFQPQASTFLDFNDAQQKYNTLLNNYNNASPYDKLRFKDKMSEKTKEFENLQSQYQSLPLPERVQSEAAAGKAETQYEDLLKANRERRFQFGIIPKKELFMDIKDYFGDIGRNVSQNVQPTENVLGTTVPMGTITGQTQYDFAGGGIAKLAGKPSGPPPESGPTPQGLDFLMKRGR